MIVLTDQSYLFMEGNQRIGLSFGTKCLIIMVSNGMFKQNDQSGCVCVPELIVDATFSYIPCRFI